ncbi:MAG TPA: iron-regulated protein [Bacteroidetes bacterium]|nr:iron-regulated protein [Bacteroidota bacterium]
MLLLLITIATLLQTADKPAYVIYNKSGEIVNYSEVVAASAEKEIVFFGELHNNPIAHWLQFELTRDLHQLDTSRTVRLGFEMFEADQQVLLDEYAANQLTTANFERETRLWDNYKTDYKPLIEYGKANGLKLVASNIPRRYASMVYSRGIESLDSLSALTKSWIAPLPIEVDLTLPGYAKMMEMAMGHGGENLPKSQAVKDATMAYFILQYHRPNDLFIHYNGSYHSANYEGILWYIQKYSPKTSMITITTIEQNDPENVELSVLGEADFTIVVNANMTKTY